MREHIPFSHHSFPPDSFSRDGLVDPDDFDEDDFATGRARRGRRRYDDEPAATGRGRLTEEARERLARTRAEAESDRRDLPEDADRFSTYADAEHGPKPLPPWVITSDSAVDSELGVLKTGKEADVYLLHRYLPGTDLPHTAGVLLAAKRYRSGEHRLFHRDAGYLEGRRMRRSREMRAIESRSAFGRNLIAERWAAAEFGALGRLWAAGVPVPYPVQRDGTEILMEFIGSADGTAAPRLAALRPEPDELTELWRQLVAALSTMAGQGMTHGDLSAYNIIVHNGILMLIDLPQVVDVAVNPQGVEYLRRDVANITGWFRSRGAADELADADWLSELLLDEAGLR